MNVVAGREPRPPSQTAAARATLIVREMLLQGRFQPGEWIREVPLAKQLGVTRVPLRLALERMAHEGLLELRPRRGFVVARFSTQDAYDAIELRGLLEGTAARLSAERLKDVRDLAPLEKASREMVALIGCSTLTLSTLESYIDLNATFHAALLELSRSRMLRQAIRHVCALPFASPNAFLAGQHGSSDLRDLFLIAADQHCGIVEAIASREGRRAEFLAREHARIARRTLENVLKASHTARFSTPRGLSLISPDLS
jgi:GntR family transcriptional regulator, vanillate catabolism transcriptional regulator